MKRKIGKNNKKYCELCGNEILTGRKKYCDTKCAMLNWKVETGKISIEEAIERAKNE